MLKKLNSIFAVLLFIQPIFLFFMAARVFFGHFLSSDSESDTEVFTILIFALISIFTAILGIRVSLKLSGYAAKLPTLGLLVMVLPSIIYSLYVFFPQALQAANFSVAVGLMSTPLIIGIAISLFVLYQAKK